jgi:putative ABC transport system substrate-binding protein
MRSESPSAGPLGNSALTSSLKAASRLELRPSPPMGERDKKRAASFRLILSLILSIAPAATPVPAFAQSAAPVPRVAILGVDPAQVWDVFQRRLRDLGYVEGRNLILERRWSQGHADRVPLLLAELVKVKPDVLVASMFPPTGRLDLAQCVPLLVIGVGEPYGTCRAIPVAQKSIASSAREVSATHLQLARAAVPSASRFVVLTNSKLPFLVEYASAFQTTAASLGATVQVLDVGGGPNLSDVTSAITREAPDVLIVGPAFDQPAVRRQIVGYATRGRIPAIGSHVMDGVVVAADYDWVDLGRRAADFVDQLLKGIKLVDLPATAPTKFEVIVDQRAAKAVGLTIPDSLRSQADQVLE